MLIYFLFVDHSAADTTLASMKENEKLPTDATLAGRIKNDMECRTTLRCPAGLMQKKNLTDATLARFCFYWSCSG